MKNRFLILLSFVLIVGRDAVCANTSMVRERININRDWRYQIDDPDGVEVSNRNFLPGGVIFLFSVVDNLYFYGK